ncbi:MAG: amino acid carrier protein, partial [Robiginitalea sp.]
MKRLFSILLGLLGLAVAAQDLQVKETISNPSNRINDGVIRLEVSGGRPPYIYKWSNQSTPLSSNRATGLVEGVPYEVEVFDAQGNTVTRVFTVPTEAITEVFNGAMTPAVSALGAVLFWDPFAATGIYDPVVYTNSRRIAIPGW